MNNINPNSFNKIGVDSTSEIFKYLEPKQLGMLAPMSKLFKKATDDELVVWKAVSKRINPKIPVAKNNYKEAVKNYFFELKQIVKNFSKPYDGKLYGGGTLEVIPEDIQAIINQETLPTEKEFSLLIAYIKARDSLRVWEKLSYNLAANAILIPKETWKSSDLIIKKSSEFSNWFNSNVSTAPLNCLNLAGLQLATIPKEIFTLTNIDDLELEANQLKSLSKKIGNLKLLNVLQLYGNQIKSLPDEITALTLKELVLANNGLDQIPAQVKDLNQLENLYLSDNKFKSVPQEIFSLKGGQYFTLRNNPLSFIPKEVGHLNGFSWFSLRGTPLLTRLKFFADFYVNKDTTYLITSTIAFLALGILNGYARTTIMDT